VSDYNLARARVVIEARKAVKVRPGMLPGLELALKRLHEAERAKALRPVQDDDAPQGPRAA
jgi:hypothetical protein